MMPYGIIEYVIIGSGNGWSLLQQQAITWINADIWSAGPFGTNFCESNHHTIILIKGNAFENVVHCVSASVKLGHGWVLISPWFMCRWLCMYRCHLTSIGIPMLKIRLSWNHLILNMVIPTPGKTVFLLRQGPGPIYVPIEYEICHHCTCR